MKTEKKNARKCNTTCMESNVGKGKSPEKTPYAQPGETFSRCLSVRNPLCAGIDMHKKTIWLCMSPSLASGTPAVSTFQTSTPELRRLVDVLKSGGVTTVAMESTGVYWMPTYRMLRDAGLDPILINPSDVKRISGRPKTDRADCIWICRLHQYGFLRSSFIAEDKVYALKELERTREGYLQECSVKKQQMIQALVKMNVRLDVVLSDVTGKSGTGMLDAILRDGVRSPAALYGLLDPQIQKKMPKEEMLGWLDGIYDETVMKMLKWRYEDYQALTARIRDVNGEIVRLLESFPKREDRGNLPPEPRNYREDSLLFDVPLRPLFFEILGRDMTQLPGIGAKLLLDLVATVGTDLSAWKDARHFTSWLGLAPVAHVSAGYSKGAKTKNSGNMLTNAFKIAAMSAQRTKTYIGCSARFLSARLLGRKARVAVARKLAVIVFNTIRNGAELFVWTEEEYERRRERKKRDKALGIVLKLINEPGIVDELQAFMERNKPVAASFFSPARA